MSHEITVTWDASPGPISGYNIYRGTTAKNESDIPLNSTLITTTSFVDNTVFPGHVYFYEVTSVLNGVESVDSIEIRSIPVPFGPSPVAIDLGAASGFGVLAGSTVTNVPGTATSVVGDVGVSPGTSITGFAAPASITGVFHSGDFVAQAAQGALTTAYNAMVAAVNPPGIGPVLPASGPYIVTSVATATSGTTLYTGTFLPGLGNGLVGQMFVVSGFINAQNNGTWMCVASTITTITLANPSGTAETATASASGLASNGTPATTLTGDIGGQTLTPGVYNSGSSLGITGTLVLDAQGNQNAVWIFQIGSTLTTAAGNSSVALVGGALASNVYWQVGSSATLGTNTVFVGTIIAQASITATTGADINGRLLARTGAVTLDTNSISLFMPLTLALEARNAPVALGTLIFDCATQTFQEAIIGGITGPSNVSFTQVIGGTTQDGSVTWMTLDPPISAMFSLPPSPPNVPPAPPAAPSNPRITSEQ